jgi:hypothetical protein
MNNRLDDLWGGDEAPAWATGDDGGGGGGGGIGSSSDNGDNNDNPQQPLFDANENDIEWGDPTPDKDEGPNGNSQPKFMESFFKDVDGIKADIDVIRNATKKVGEINEEAILATSTAREEELSNQLKPLIDQTNKRAKRTKNLLALLKEENKKLEGEKTVTASDMR